MPIVYSAMATGEGGSGPIDLEEVTGASPGGAVAEARELLLEYGQFAVVQPGAAGFCFGSLEKEAARLPHSFHEQGGGCLVARIDGRAAGLVAWRELTPSNVVVPGAWEMKRLWVRPSGRGLGLGRLLTHAVLDRAAAAGQSAVYLDTAPASMGSAYRIYLELGFKPCSPYNNNPVEGLEYLMKLV